jgi:mannose-6-phosphate isomerase-like protein (cupin superfamily)
VSPGTIHTSFHDRFSNAERREAMRQTIPMGRLGAADDCAGTFLYLASDKASGYVTGQVLAASARGSMAHFELPPGHVSKAVAHRTVEELWFITCGQGRFWRKNETAEETVDIHPGVSIAIPVGTHFQFRVTAMIRWKPSASPCRPGQGTTRPMT